MRRKLQLDRDFTRFLNDPTFPYKVTVCIGDERILCSGALLAQQSSVLEKKFREDDGVLMFEELVDVDGKSDGLQKCLNFLHGADVHFTISDLAVCLKFASFYEIIDLFVLALEWLRGHLSTSNTSVRDAVTFLKLSHCFSNLDDSTKLRDVIQCFIQSNKEIFSSQVVNYLDEGVTGFDIITMLNLDIDNGAEILKKWAPLSAENGSFIIKNHSCFDLMKIFPNEEEFSSFICLISEGTAGSSISFKALLDIQKAFFTAQLTKNFANVATSSKSLRNHAQAESFGLKYDDVTAVTLVNENSAILTLSKTHLTGRELSKPNFPRHNSTVFVYDLPLGYASGWELWKTFQFAGKIKSISFCLEEESAEVEFFKVYSANNLLRHNYEQGPFIIDGQPIILQPGFGDDVWSSFNFTDNQIVVWSFPSTVSKTKLRKLFSFGGRIESIDIYPNDFYAVITYHDVSSAETVRSSLDDFLLDGMPLYIVRCISFSSSEDSISELSQPSREEKFNERRLYIGNIPTSAHVDELKQMFSGFGKIIKLDLKRKGKHPCYAFITFQNARSACNLLQSSYKRNFIYDGTVLKIEKVK